MATIELDASQRQAVSDVKGWLDEGGRQRLTLGGYAGTGKTTVVSWLREHDPRFKMASFAAFTGKAAAVLREKGVPAQTIHSTIYRNDGNGKFILNPELVKNKIKLMVIDEASMVAKQQYDDLRECCKSILFIGDHGQLEPIGKDPKLMRDPDIRLETIHRQAEGDPILRFAHQLREGVRPHATGFDGIRPISNFWEDEAWRSKDIIICGTNNTRHRINRLRRWEIFGDHVMHEVEQMPLEGDRVICLHNNHEAGIFNGMMGTLEKIHTVRGNTIIADIRDDSDRLFFRMGIVADQFGRNKEQNANNWEGELFDFGYALTCHKAQGSEYESGVVIDECFKFQQVSNFNAPRWRYTAATRFKTQDLEYYA